MMRVAMCSLPAHRLPLNPLQSTQGWPRAPGRWHGASMLMLALLLALLIVIIVMVVTRRNIGRLGSLATLIAAAMLAHWLIDSGLVPGSKGPLEGDRATTPQDR